VSAFTEVRLALRGLAKSPAFTAAAVATLALGIGANTAMFSVIDAVLLRPLPYPSAERLVQIWWTDAGQVGNSHAAADFLDLEAEVPSFDALAGYQERAYHFSGAGAEAERVDGAEVTASFFEVFGVRAAAGTLRAADGAVPGESRVVLSHGLWEARFAKDPAVVGRRVRIDGVPRTVLGVAEPGFSFPDDARIWALADRRVPAPPIPLAGPIEAERRLQYFLAVGRLAEGASLEEAQQESSALAARLEKDFPVTNAKRGVRLVSLLEETVGSSRTPLFALLGAVALLLLVACANLAALLLSRAAARQREVSIRVALGAPRGRIARMFLIESLVLSLSGGGLGVIAASWGRALLIRLAPEGMPRLSSAELDLRVLAASSALTILCGLLFGLAPALSASRMARGRSSFALNARDSSAERAGVRRLLAGMQIAVAVVLSAGAALLLASLRNLERVDPGFRPESVVAIPLWLSGGQYADAGAAVRLYTELAKSLAAAPEVDSVAVGFPVPLFGGGAFASYLVEGQPAPAPGLEPSMHLGCATPGYFRTLGIPLLSGRDLEEGDGAVAVINAELSRRAFAGRNPLGRRIRVGDDPSAWHTVVGVVGDARREHLDQPPPPTAWLPISQLPVPYQNVFVRTRTDTAGAVSAVRRELARLDRDLGLGTPHEMREIVSGAADDSRFRARLISAFAAAGLLLSAIGLYGVVAASVLRRRRELGIRLALGATRGGVARLVLREGVLVALAGLAAGLLVALAAGRLLSSLLFGVAASDPATFAGAAIFLLAVALIASALPALRAARLDPVEVLRSEP
jgi:putative ABC transport system permease protein